MEASYYAYQNAVYANTAAGSTQQDPQEEEEDEEYEDENDARFSKGGNVLPFWGNQQTMNLNPLILTNIRNSPYSKVNLVELKTYHEVVDEIYYKVSHLEPWEKGSRKTSGQTGMCGGVRGVGAGGIISSAFCLLYKLSTIKLTHKQIISMMNHADSPFIRGLGFMYVRFTQPPADLMGWFEDYLDDEEVIDCKAGGGKEITIGEMVKQFLTKLEWFDTRFPRIPVPVQKEISEYFEQMKKYAIEIEDVQVAEKNAEKEKRSRDRDAISSRREKDRHHDRRRSHEKSRDRKRSRSPKGEKRKHHGSSKHDRRSDDRHKRRSRSRDRDQDRPGRSGGDDYQNELKKFSEHRKKEKKHKRSKSRSRSRERDRRR